MVSKAMFEILEAPSSVASVKVFARINPFMVLGSLRIASTLYFSVAHSIAAEPRPSTRALPSLAPFFLASDIVEEPADEDITACTTLGLPPLTASATPISPIDIAPLYTRFPQ